MVRDLTATKEKGINRVQWDLRGKPLVQSARGGGRGGRGGGGGRGGAGGRGGVGLEARRYGRWGRTRSDHQRNGRPR